MNEKPNLPAQPALSQLEEPLAVSRAERLRRKIEIVDYDPDWPAQFAREAGRIKARLGASALAIDHVGSTAVPGLAAKPVLDIVLTVKDSADETRYSPALESIGYTLIIREPEWFEHRMLKRQEPAINLHAFPDGCPEIARMTLFRDWLRTNASDRERYARTKRLLAVKDWACVQDYADAKTAIVRQIMVRAQAHAQRAT